MNSQNLDQLVQSSERLYEERLRAQIEPTHPNDFIAIEPISGDYFLGKTLSEAGGKA